MAVDTRLGQDRPAGTPRELFPITGPSFRDYAVTPDGQRFLAVVSEPLEMAGSAVVLLGWTPPWRP